jgi:hypothetical protein
MNLPRFHDLDKKIMKLLNDIHYSKKAQGFYFIRPDAAAARMRDLFIKDGWTPPPEAPKATEKPSEPL